VLLFGGIETTEGMIANAVLHLLEHPGLPQATGAPRTVELTRRNPAHPGSRVLWS